ncbi:hypothetical protein MA16_Dca022310 [Dendrobium catenatum]|uniref:Uncharacterized protein n=1 Tax=Dendrobium catenatum TaxID=906689 RepID=A0A2I0XA98_9ASPA|nr:hypothetical protein MA16_Dca022310 [Dendrobium catenatum]
MEEEAVPLQGNLPLALPEKGNYSFRGNERFLTTSEDGVFFVDGEQPLHKGPSGNLNDKTIFLSDLYHCDAYTDTKIDILAKCYAIEDNDFSFSKGRELYAELSWLVLLLGLVVSILNYTGLLSDGKLFFFPWKSYYCCLSMVFCTGRRKFRIFARKQFVQDRFSFLPSFWVLVLKHHRMYLGTLREELSRNPLFEKKKKVREMEFEGITRLLRASYTLAPPMAFVILEGSFVREASRSSPSGTCLLHEGEKRAEVLCLL